MLPCFHEIRMGAIIQPTFAGLARKWLNKVTELSHTQRKLREARFFLHQLMAANSMEEVFLFYLSAFLTASASVASVLQVEAKIKQKAFHRWRDDLPSADRELFCSMTGHRDEHVHRMPARPEMHLVPAIPVLDRHKRPRRMEVLTSPTTFKTVTFLDISGHPSRLFPWRAWSGCRCGF
jgi:hypothetical protein